MIGEDDNKLISSLIECAMDGSGYENMLVILVLFQFATNIKVRIVVCNYFKVF